MGMAYANNLVYIVCFYLTMMGLALAKITNDHVDKVYIEKVYLHEAFAESDQTLYVVVRNTTPFPLKQVEVLISRQKYIIKTNLKSADSQTIELQWSPHKRGLQKLPVIRVQSSYPAGLFQAWKVLKSPGEVIVYPTRRGQRDFPHAGSSPQDAVGLLKEIREYRAGDSPKRIHWRSLAKNNQLRTLVHEGNETPACQLDWQQLQHLALESRLEQLALWISSAQAQGNSWKLVLPDMEFDSQNINASKLALTKLALWK